MKLVKRKYLCESAKLTRIYAIDDDGTQTQINEKITRGIIKDRIELSEKEETVRIRKMYSIYAGMRGSFGGKTFQHFSSYENEEDALDDARGIAIEEYESYEGYHGILTQEECEENGYMYEDEVDGWIDYSADEVSYEDIISISKEEGLDLDCICNALNELNLCNKIQLWRSKDEDSK